MSHAANLRASQRARAPHSTESALLENGTKFTAQNANGILKGSNAQKLTATPSENVKALKQKNQNHSSAKIGHVDTDVNIAHDPPEVFEISSDESEDDEDDVDEDAKEDGEGTARAYVNGISSADHLQDGVLQDDFKEQAEAGQKELEQRHTPVSESEGQSFGDLLRARGGEIVDVTAQDEEREESRVENAPSRVEGSSLPIPHANSLGTVLTQALRTNDTALLESCLHVGNLQSIRATIERLPSPQAGNLLQKLAERMYKRPGRAGSLMVWVQWTIVAHGGYLATQPAVMNDLKELYRVVKIRANALQPLLSLKGKLDMLEAQLQLRRNRMASHAQADSDSDGAIMYFEPESEEEEGPTEDGDSKQPGTKRLQGASKTSLHHDVTFDSEEEDDQATMANGEDLNRYAEDYSDDDEDEDQNLIDDEAESTDSDGEDLSDEDIDLEDVDGQEEGSSDDNDEEQPAAKRSKPSR